MRRTSRTGFLVLLLGCSLLLTGCPKKAEEEEKSSETVDSSFDQAYPAAQYSQPAAAATATQATATQATAGQTTTPQASTSSSSSGSTATKQSTLAPKQPVQSGLSQAELDAWLKKALASGFSKSQTAEPGSSGDDKVPDGQGPGATQLNAAGAQTGEAKTILPENAQMTPDEKRRIHEAKIQGEAEAYRQAYDRLRDVLTAEGPNSANAAKVLADYKKAVESLNTSKKALVEARKAQGGAEANLAGALGGSAVQGGTTSGGGETSAGTSTQGESFQTEPGFQQEGAFQQEAGFQRETGSSEAAPQGETAFQPETGFQGETFQTGAAAQQEGSTPAAPSAPAGSQESGAGQVGGSTETTDAATPPPPAAETSDSSEGSTESSSNGSADGAASSEGTRTDG